MPYFLHLSQARVTRALSLFLFRFLDSCGPPSLASAMDGRDLLPEAICCVKACVCVCLWIRLSLGTSDMWRRAAIGIAV
jgi:hypothetical protein